MSQDLGTARIVRLKPGAAGPCFFLVPGTGGKIEGFVNLAQHLEIAIPTFTIKARGFDEASAPDTNVEEMAEHYVTQLRTVQAIGPYFLLGHSFGGLVALEMAQLLVGAGQKIACLIMLDTPTPEKYWPFFFSLKNRATKLRRRAAAILSAPLQENLDYFRRKLSSRSIDLRQMPTDVMIGDNVARVLLAHSIARENYRPRFYEDRLIFFRPLERPAGYERLWRHRVRDLQVLSAAGDHVTMVDPPHAALLAADLSKWVNNCLVGRIVD